MAPDGTRSSAVLTTPNPDYWTLEPAFAISYLSGTWNITGNFFYDINGPTQGHCCVGAAAPSGVILPGLGETSGNLFYGDLHALYKMGKWSFCLLYTSSLAASLPFPKKLGDPTQFAALARHLIENRYINGEVIRIDAALRMAPR